jgi:TolB-like protein/Tfp pilus assembly protein PilF
MLGSPAFAQAERLRAFLQLVVERTLQGRHAEIKETVIGVEVFGRRAEYDPKLDPIVRVCARQLRQKLQDYYAAADAADEVLIDLPKGTYVPRFLPRHVPIALAPGTVPDVPAAPIPPTRTGHRILFASAAALIAILTIALIALRLTRASGGGSAEAAIGPAPAATTIAVLPLKNLGADPADEYFSDGLTDEISYALARTDGLRVVARTSTFTFKGRAEDVRVLGRRLNAGTVLEGSVRHAGDRLRVTVQLSRTADGYQLWTEAYDRQLADSLSVQAEIARAIAAALQLRLPAVAANAETRAPSTRDVEAHDLYLRGRFEWNKRSPAAMHRSIDYLQRAIDRDPAYALAWMGLATNYATMAMNNQAPPGELPPKAEAAAKRALELDPRMGEAYVVLGQMKAFYEWEWTDADALFQRALALAPGYATGHSWYATTLVARHRLEEATAELRRAQELDPLSMPIRYSLGETLFYMRRYDECIAQARALLADDAEPFRAYNLLLRAMYMKRDLAGLRAIAAQAPANIAADARFSIAMLTSPAETRRMVDDRVRAGEFQNNPYDLADFHAQLGDTTRAFELLQQAFDQRQLNLVSLDVDPLMDPIRGDPRFQRLLERLHLKPLSRVD